MASSAGQFWYWNFNIFLSLRNQNFRPYLEISLKKKSVGHSHTGVRQNQKAMNPETVFWHSFLLLLVLLEFLHPYSPYCHLLFQHHQWMMILIAYLLLWQHHHYHSFTFDNFNCKEIFTWININIDFTIKDDYFHVHNNTKNI